MSTPRVGIWFIGARGGVAATATVGLIGLQKQLKWCFDQYQVLVAASRVEAIAQLRRFEPRVVLQDLGLPPDAEGASPVVKLGTCHSLGWLLT